MVGGGDEEGSLTFVNALDESVNDICAVSQEILNLVDEFVVEDETWSDHLPIRLRIKITAEWTDYKRLNLLPKLVWNRNSIDSYRINFNRNLQKSLSRYNDLTLEELGTTIKL